MSTTIIEELQRHVKASKKIIGIWEKKGPPGGPLEENLRMISEEVAFLESMRVAHPRRANGLDRLADRYRNFRRSLTEG